MQRVFTAFVCAAAIGTISHAAAQSPAKETVGDRLWIWAHPAGVYNGNFLAPLGRDSHIEPADAADRMGLRNVIFVRYDGRPEPPFEAYYRPFEKFPRVYWSMVGASGATSETQSAKRSSAWPNSSRTWLASSLTTSSIARTPVPPKPWSRVPAKGTPLPFPASLTPEQLHELGRRTVRGQKLPIMAVVYTGQISLRAKAHLDEVDQVCMWTWRPEDLNQLETNLAALEKLVPGKPIFLGCYMYDFAASRPIPMALMQRQTELGYQWLRQGRIAGMIFLATANVDVGLEAVEWAREWIGKAADQPLNDERRTKRE